MARLGKNDPNLYDIDVRTGKLFGACAMGQEAEFEDHGCMDGYTWHLNVRVLFICSCPCHTEVN